MESELIKVVERDGKQLVSARELYMALGYDASSFSKWAKTNITDNQYMVEGEDWAIVLNSDIDNQWISNPMKAPKDYALSINMAKKIAMMARTEVGNKVRDYFLECERTSKGLIIPDFTNPAEAAIAWAEQYKAKEAAQLEAKKAQARVDLLVHDAKTYTTSEIAKELNLKSANQLNKVLGDKSIQYKLNGTWLLYSNYSDKDYTSIKQTVLDCGKIVFDRRWTSMGRDFIINLLKYRE